MYWKCVLYQNYRKLKELNRFSKIEQGLTKTHNTLIQSLRDTFLFLFISKKLQQKNNCLRHILSTSFCLFQDIIIFSICNIKNETTSFQLFLVHFLFVYIHFYFMNIVLYSTQVFSILISSKYFLLFCLVFYLDLMKSFCHLLQTFNSKCGC